MFREEAAQKYLRFLFMLTDAHLNNLKSSRDVLSVTFRNCTKHSTTFSPRLLSQWHLLIFVLALHRCLIRDITWTTCLERFLARSSKTFTLSPLEAVKQPAKRRTGILLQWKAETKPTQTKTMSRFIFFPFHDFSVLAFLSITNLFSHSFASNIISPIGKLLIQSPLPIMSLSKEFLFNSLKNFLCSSAAAFFLHFSRRRFFSSLSLSTFLLLLFCYISFIDF